ncbi:hypothetical protein WA556_005271, partial [Blastocystis sp. ATCC 50177/Nand II]
MTLFWFSIAGKGIAKTVIRIVRAVRIYGGYGESSVTAKEADASSQLIKQAEAGKEALSAAKEEEEYMFPTAMKRLQYLNDKDKGAGRKVGALFGGGVCLYACGLLYTCNGSYVPITNRRHYIFFSFETELQHQSRFLYQMNYYEGAEGSRLSGNPVITDSTDIRYRLVHRVVGDIQRACVYFDPSCKEYMNKMKIFVVDSPEVNAFSSVGGIIVVYTGLINHYVELEAEGKVPSAEECIAGVIAHELSHSIARHSIETNVHWSVLLSYLTILLLDDVFVAPEIVEIIEDTLSRKCESEADFMALYLLKHAGYDIHEFGRTLSLLGEENVLSPTTQRLFALLEDHPCIPDRVRNIERSISVVERDFETKYRGENAGGVPE